MFLPFKSAKKKYKSRADVKNSIREFLLDTQTPNAYSLSLALGCTPISDELADREEEESEKRVERISHLFPFITTYSTIYAEAFVALLFENMEEIPEEFLDVVENLAGKVQVALEEGMGNAITGAVSQLVDNNLLSISRSKK